MEPEKSAGDRLDSLFGPAYVNVRYIYMRSVMSTLIERVDDYGRPAWIGLMVLGFILCWPVGLIILGFLIGSGRMGCWSHHYGDSWRNDRWQRRMNRMQRGV